MFFDSYLPAALAGGKKSKAKNRWSYGLVLDRLIRDALRLRYKITGLPDTCDERLTLLSLLWEGRVAFVEHEGSILSLPATEGDGPTIYGRYTRGYVTSLNGVYTGEVQMMLPGDESPIVTESTAASGLATGDRGVMVYESETRLPFILYAQYYAEAISDTLRTIEVARRQLKRPWIIACEEAMLPSVRKALSDIDDNDKSILSSGALPIDRIKPLDLKASPDSVRAACELVQWYEERYKSLCGLPSNGSIDKKGANLIQGELSIGSIYGESQIEGTIETLNSGLETANRFFGTQMRAERIRHERTESTASRADDDLR